MGAPVQIVRFLLAAWSSVTFLFILDKYRPNEGDAGKGRKGEGGNTEKDRRRQGGGMLLQVSLCVATGLLRPALQCVPSATFLFSFDFSGRCLTMLSVDAGTSLALRTLQFHNLSYPHRFLPPLLHLITCW